MESNTLLKILVVDDSPTQLMLMRSILEKESDLQIETAADGNEALAQLQRSPADLVLTDLQMPGMDGLELVRSVKAASMDVPVILTTSRGSEAIASEALQAGAASYVPKRLLDQALVTTIRQVRKMVASAAVADVAGALVGMTLHLELANDEALIPPIIARIEAAIAEMKLFEEGDRTQINMALDEALTNAITHGNLQVSSELREQDDGAPYRELIARRREESPYRDRRTRITCEACRGKLRIVIADDGDGFDVASLPDPTDPANLESISGRGLLLINAFMDEVTHNDRGNEITLLKRVAEEPIPA